MCAARISASLSRTTTLSDNATYESGGLDETRQRFYYGITKLMKDLSYIRKPTIAMVNGVAAGFGMDMSLQCDSPLRQREHAIHLLPAGGQIIENGGAYYLTRLAGLGRALEFSFTGHLDGQTAAEWGVLNRLVPSEELEAEVRALCDRIMRNPPAGHLDQQAGHPGRDGQHARNHGSADLERLPRFWPRRKMPPRRAPLSGSAALQTSRAAECSAPRSIEEGNVHD